MGNFKPPVEFLWEKYSYNLLTGRFHLMDTDRELKGNTVGSLARSHQLSLSADHRYPYGVCVFAWLNGRWPSDGMQIDHINCDPFDHRPWNIREITRGENLARRRRRGHLPVSAVVEHPPVMATDSLPDYLQDALSSTLSFTSRESMQKEIECTPLQLSCICKMGWAVPTVGIRTATCYKPVSRRKLSPSTRFYDVAIAALRCRAIHIGDLAHLWLAVVSGRVTKPSMYVLMYGLSRILGHSIVMEDGMISIGETTLSL